MYKTPQEVNKEIDEAEKNRNLEYLLEERYDLLPEIGSNFTLMYDAVCYNSSLAVQVPDEFKNERTLKELIKYSREFDSQIECGFLQAQKNHNEDKKPPIYEEAFWYALEEMPEKYFEDKEFMRVLKCKKNKAIYSKVKTSDELNWVDKFNKKYNETIDKKKETLANRRKTFSDLYK